MNAVRKVWRWPGAHWPELAAMGVLCLPTVWSILYLCGVVARGPL